MDIADCIGLSNKSRIEAERLTTNGPFENETRLMLVAGFLDLALEYHEAIMFLLENKFPGAALALIRPLFEAVWRGHWMMTVATDEQVEQLRTGALKFPKFNDLVDQIDTACKTDGLYSQFKGKIWNAMNDYTHGGTKHLSKRLLNDSIKANYPEGEVIEAVYNTTVGTLLFCGFFCGAVGKAKEREEIHRLMASYQGLVSIQ